MEQLYFVFMIPNHRDLVAKLIGITDNPQEYINKYISDRTLKSSIITDTGADIVFNSGPTEADEHLYAKNKHNVNKPLYHYELRYQKIKAMNNTTFNIECGDLRYY